MEVAKTYSVLSAAALGSSLQKFCLVLPLPSLFAEVPSPDNVLLFVVIQIQKCCWPLCLIQGSWSCSLASVSCPFLLLPLVSSEESAQMLPGILALAEHLHAARLCTKHPCNTTSGAQSRRKDLSEVITNQAEKYQQKTGNTQQKLCLLRAAHALPTTRFNC